MGLSLGSLTVALDADSRALDAGFAKAQTSTATFGRALDKTGKKAKTTGGRISRAFKRGSKQINLTRGHVLALTAAFTVLGAGVVSSGRSFSKALGELEAITGATGADLQFLTEATKEFARTTTISAVEAAAAFKLIASSKSELLSNIPALKAVTKEAIALAEAAGIDLPQAAEALGNTLNQFGLDADQASRVINVLAAGSQLGAKEIPFLTQAMREAAPVAKLLGISIEETTGILEGLGRAGITAEKAGTGFRNFFTILSTSGIAEFNVEALGAVQVIKNLEAANFGLVESEALFGREVLVAASAITQQSGFIETLITNITGTDTAYVQAAINAGTFDGSMKKLTNSLQLAGIALFEVMEPGLVAVTKGLTKTFTVISENSGVISNVFTNLIGNLLIGVTQIEFAFKAVGETIKFAFLDAFGFITQSFEKMLSVLGSATARVPGLGSLSDALFDATGSLSRGNQGAQGFEQTIGNLQSQRDRQIAQINSDRVDILASRLPGTASLGEPSGAQAEATSGLRSGFQGRADEIDVSTLPQLGSFTSGTSSRAGDTDRIVQEMRLMREAFERGENTLELKVEVNEQNIVRLVTKNPAFQKEFDKRTLDAARQIAN